MGELSDRRNALRAAMAAAMPARRVTRDFLDFAQRQEDDLLAGVVTIIGQGEKDYAGNLGRLAQLGTMPLIVVGQLKVAEDAPPSAVEDAEDALADEIKNFCRSLADPLLGGLSMRLFRQSGQMDHPYGWIAAELEILT